jgi:hypothetical protein
MLSVSSTNKWKQWKEMTLDNAMYVQQNPGLEWAKKASLFLKCYLVLIPVYIFWNKYKVKVKSKLSLCLTKHHAMKTCCILDLGTRWRWVVSFTSRPLYPQGKSPWHPLDRRLGGVHSCSGRGGEEKNSQPPPGIDPLETRSSSP